MIWMSHSVFRTEHTVLLFSTLWFSLCISHHPPPFTESGFSKDRGQHYSMFRTGMSVLSGSRRVAPACSQSVSFSETRMASDFAPPTDLCLSTGGMRLLIQPLLKVVYGLLPFCWFCCVWCFLLFMLIC